MKAKVTKTKTTKMKMTKMKMTKTKITMTTTTMTTTTMMMSPNIRRSATTSGKYFVSLIYFLLAASDNDND